MRNFYSRDKRDFVLEEDKDNGNYPLVHGREQASLFRPSESESLDAIIEQNIATRSTSPRTRSPLARSIAKPSTC